MMENYLTYNFWISVYVLVTVRLVHFIFFFNVWERQLVKLYPTILANACSREYQTKICCSNFINYIFCLTKYKTLNKCLIKIVCT